MQSLEEKIQSEFRVLQEDEFNQFCCDCHMKDPQWCCINHGIFLCLQCAGAHRSMGGQISIVRSIKMDTWDDFQLALMKFGGNQKFSDYLNLNGLGEFDMLNKYNTVGAEYYRKRLRAQAANEPFNEPAPGIEEAGLMAREEVKQAKAKNKFQQAFINFGQKIKKGTKDLGNKEQMRAFKEKSQNFFDKMNSGFRETVNKTKESQAFKKFTEGSKNAIKVMKESSQKMLDKMKRKNNS